MGSRRQDGAVADTNYSGGRTLVPAKSAESGGYE